MTRRGLLAGIATAAVAAAGLGACASDGDGDGDSGGAGGAGPAPTASGSSEAELRRKIASLLIAGFRGETVRSGDWIMRAISEQGLGGVILFDRDELTGGPRNITSPQQVTSLIHTLKGATPRRLIVSIDQEGGKIARLSPSNGFPATQSAAEIGAVNDPAVTRAWAHTIVDPLVQIGVNVNFTPVADLASNPDNPAIARLSRSFSADPNVVVACATEEIRVHREAGVKTSIKHFPGFGSATGNTDFEIVDVSDTWSRGDLVPFQRLIQTGMTDMVMVAHFLNRQLDPDRPVSMSRAVIQDLLRGELGWQGVVVTDDMQAKAVSALYGRDVAMSQAIEAGVDLLTLCNQQEYDEDVVEATISVIAGMVRDGRITEAQIDQSVARVDAIRPA